MVAFRLEKDCTARTGRIGLKRCSHNNSRRDEKPVSPQCLLDFLTSLEYHLARKAFETGLQDNESANQVRVNIVCNDRARRLRPRAGGRNMRGIRYQSLARLAVRTCAVRIWPRRLKGL